MRFPMALVLSGLMMFGCGNDGGATGTGGSGALGGAGGEGGGGPGGTGGADPGSVYVFTSPVPPCAEGVASNYTVNIFAEGSRTAQVRFPECTGLIEGDRSTVMCPSDEAGLDFSIELSSGGGVGIDYEGTFQACSGFLFRDVNLLKDELVVDLFAFPIPPCEAGAPSDYLVEVFVDGAPEPFELAGDFPDCTGAVDSARNRITCSNEADVLRYGLTIAEGLDWQVSVYGSWKTCTAFLAKGAER
jgi:hypothetical protein